MFELKVCELRQVLCAGLIVFEPEKDSTLYISFQYSKMNALDVRDGAFVFLNNIVMVFHKSKDLTGQPSQVLLKKRWDPTKSEMAQLSCTQDWRLGKNSSARTT